MNFNRIIAILILLPYFGCKADTNFILLDISKNILPVIVVPDVMSEHEKQALQVMKSAFLNTSSVPLKVLQESKIGNAYDTQPIIYLGNTKAFAKLNQLFMTKEGYYIYQNKNAIFLASKSSNGLLYATYYFIENFLKSSKLDEGKIVYQVLKYISIPANLKVNQEPAFEFRQAYFPASNKQEYQLWHATNSIDKEWSCWGHNLSKFIKQKTGKALTSNSFALVNGKRNDEQFCFSSNELYNLLVESIKVHEQEGNANSKFSISPNDNSFICTCEHCEKINANTGSASNTVCRMMNRLAQKFPNQTFTTLAYVTTLKPPTNLKLESNTAVVLSTIDLPKGIAIEKQKEYNSFNKLVEGWKAVCNSIYVWDYPIQYTNYFDIFPNLPSLQADLKYFKKVGIKGVFEQGSEESYSVFCEWKCFAISKLLWNPNIDLSETRKRFFNEFYGSLGMEVESFYEKCESNLQQRNALLDIYGNVGNSEKAYLNYAELLSLLQKLRQAVGLENEIEARVHYNIYKLATCLEILNLQYQQLKGIDELGYAQAVNQVSWKMKPEVLSKINKLKKATVDNEISYMNENKFSVENYLNEFEIFLNTMTTKNLIWNQPIKFRTSFDDTYPAKGNKTLNDGLNGSRDYSFNWLLFNGVDMSVSIHNMPNANKISINFLNDPPHYILAPKSIKLFQGDDLSNLKLLEEIKPTIDKRPESNIYSFTSKINGMKTGSTLHIIAENYKQLPDWKPHATKKPTIACDEINIQ